MEPTFIQVLYPDRYWASAEQVRIWAADDWADAGYDGDPPEGIEEMIELIEDSGTVTFGAGRRY